MPIPIENMKVVLPHKYIVWTQAGFNRALKTVNDVFDTSLPVMGYPTTYPSLVTFSAQYEGYEYWYAQCIPLNKAIQYLKDELEFIESADREHQQLLKEGV